MSIVVPMLPNCSRCGMNHAEIEFVEFKRPVLEQRLSYRWWATCPYTGEPILMRQLLNEEATDAATEEDPRYLSPQEYSVKDDQEFDDAYPNGAKSG